jgi:hypothetical protein
MVATPPGGAATLPRRGSTGLFARVRALPEHRVVDRLLRSRLWIWALGALLGGIVTMQVSLLKLNSGISRAVETTTTLERQNADLETAIARLSAPDRIDTGARTLGMVQPDAGQVSYLRSGPQDASRAVRHMQPPSEAAAALLANSGVVPGSDAPPPVAPTSTATAPADSAGGTVPETTPTTTPTTTDPPPVATDAPVSTPVPTTAQQPSPTTSQVSPAGGAVAGQG